MSRKVLVDDDVLQMIINALERDAEAGRPVKGEMAEELKKVMVYLNDIESYPSKIEREAIFGKIISGSSDET